MKPATHLMFPIGESGGKDRSIIRAYFAVKKQFKNPNADIEMANYKCAVGGEQINAGYCREHNSRAYIERRCMSCGRVGLGAKCESCGGATIGSSTRNFNIVQELDKALANLQMTSPPKTNTAKSATSAAAGRARTACVTIGPVYAPVVMASEATQFRSAGGRDIAARLLRRLACRNDDGD